MSAKSADLASQTRYHAQLAAGSRSADSMISIRYAMSGFELGEELLGIPALTSRRLFKALPDAFARVCTRGDIQQTLIGRGAASEIGQRLAFFGDVDRDHAPT